MCISTLTDHAFEYDSTKPLRMYTQFVFCQRLLMLEVAQVIDDAKFDELGMAAVEAGSNSRFLFSLFQKIADVCVVAGD